MLWLTSALLAQGMSVWDAARAGATYHGRAGEAKQARLGARGVTVGRMRGAASSDARGLNGA